VRREVVGGLAGRLQCAFLDHPRIGRLRSELVFNLPGFRAMNRLWALKSGGTFRRHTIAKIRCSGTASVISMGVTLGVTSWRVCALSRIK
jgi:hypothetical protein